MYSQSLHGWLIAKKQTYLFYTRCAIQVQFLIVREIYKIIIEWVQNEYKKTVNEKENKTQMNLDMTQFGATQNQKQAQARTLLWGKHIKFQPCPCGRALEIERAQGDGQVVLLQWKWPRHIEVFQTKKTMDDGYYTYVEIRLMSTL